MSASIPELYKKFKKSAGVSTDTRKIFKDCLFFALKGDRFNGNDFAATALEAGACGVVIDEMNPGLPDLPEKIFLTENVLRTLQELARFHRNQLSIPFIAVGGSNGKTTTKELIKAVLSKKYRTYATQGNLNNHIGVPLTLLSIHEDTEMAVIEMGANHEGEIAELCRITNPDYGIITNIGLDHLEGFGSVEGVARANGELFVHLKEKQGIAFVNTDEPDLVKLGSLAGKIVTFPNPGDDFRLERLPSDFFIQYRTAKGEVIQTNLFGSYNFSNLAAALCIGDYFGVEEKLAAEAVGQYIPSNNRSQIIRVRSNIVLLDAYNANPSSMEQAIGNFAAIKAEKKMVILGDMYELGEYSEEEHRKLGERVAQAGFDTILFFGEAIREALKTNPKAYYFNDKFSLHNWLQDRKTENTIVLIKGSRGVSLETVIQFL